MCILVSKEGNTTYLRSLPYCKEVCEDSINLAMGKGTELISAEIFKRMIESETALACALNLMYPYIYFAHNTPLYLNIRDSLVLRICQHSLETS